MRVIFLAKIFDKHFAAGRCVAILISILEQQIVERLADVPYVALHETS